MTSSIASSITERNPLAPETLVVQHPGMARWLSLRLAERLGLELRNEEVDEVGKAMVSRPRLGRRFSPHLPAVRIRLTD